jgi:hypothetical protein
MPSRFGVMRWPEEMGDLVTRNLASRLSAEIQRQSKLEFGLRRQADPTRVDLGLAEYAASYR